ncbi:hypothetical protein L1987_59953 [Smallanthus sonchifolius]|uniref:Uncharacterized protein n=1 Tax=Smallanthus sonchifolius TaxID=185202 RepID=A0ACB9D744_9ASTR|nr:hypothetical protein L1987_59953 [Smallanthus sonchifolius]
MVLTGKMKKKRANGGIGGGDEGWGMDIFVPEEEHQQHLTSTTPSSSPFKRTNSSQNLTRLQSTISICALLIFLTLLLFTLSSFEPSNIMGSVVGFGVGELDPENSLSGFVDRVPMSLRRWACYPMILGRVRRHYKHVMLVDVNKVLLLGDPLGRVKNPSPESVFLSSTVDETINPAVIMGGMRGIRRLSAAVLAEIVRATMTQQHYKRKVSVTESSLLRRVATNEFTLKSITISIVTSVGDTSSLAGSSIGNETIVWLENSGTDIESVIM